MSMAWRVITIYGDLESEIAFYECARIHWQGSTIDGTFVHLHGQVFLNW